MSGKLEEESRAFLTFLDIPSSSLTKHKPPHRGGGQFAQLYQRYNIKAQNRAIRELCQHKLNYYL